MADFRPFSPRWGDISFTEAPQTTARCYAGAIFLSYSPSERHREPAGVEGAARHGAWPRRRWAAAGPGQATSRRVEAPISNPGPTGLEGAGGTRGPGCGARGRWRGLAGLRHDRTPSAAGVEGAGVSGGPGCGAGGRRQGQGGLRDRHFRAFRLACGDLAGGRARRRPEHPWGHKQHKQEGRHPREQPAARPNNTPRGAQNTSGATRHLGTTKPPSPTGAGRLRQSAREGQRRITTMSGSPRPLS